VLANWLSHLFPCLIQMTPLLLTARAKLVTSRPRWTRLAASRRAR
jgi:hypothetical protein